MNSGKCTICPRRCNIIRPESLTNRIIDNVTDNIAGSTSDATADSTSDNTAVTGICGMGRLPVVARAALHYWEEPCISGERGSGTVFFSGCSLKCVYCQNYKISHEGFGAEITVKQLRAIFDSLIEQGAHNINLVNPTHFTEAVAEALTSGGKLKVPVVYNSGGYDSVGSLKKLDGLIDVYLPDLKYFDLDVAKKYSGVSDYFAAASQAIKEMYRQVGVPRINDEGIIERGLIIRHLIIPGQTSQSKRILKWIKDYLPEGVMVSLMSQYIPCGKAGLFPEIDRRVSEDEYQEVLDYLYELDLLDGYVQEHESADDIYIPDFNLQGVHVKPNNSESND